MILKIEGFVKVRDPILLGDGLHGPSRSKFKQVLHAGSEGMVSEEGKENSAFSKFRSVAHGGLGLSLNCSPDVEIKALQDYEIFTAASEFISKLKSRCSVQGLWDFTMDKMMLIMSAGQILG